MGYVVSREILKAFGCADTEIVKDGIVCDKFGQPLEEPMLTEARFLAVIVIAAIIGGIGWWLANAS